MNLGEHNNDGTQDRKKVREVLCGAFEKFEGELAGKFYDLGTLSDEDRNMLLSSGFLFQIPKTTNLLWHAGAAKNWPTVRIHRAVGCIPGAVRILRLDYRVEKKGARTMFPLVFALVFAEHGSLLHKISLTGTVMVFSKTKMSLSRVGCSPLYNIPLRGSANRS